jgi:O-antigen ligase
MNRSFTKYISGSITWISIFILAILPFHEFLTTWIGSNFGHLDAWRSWKEIVILILLPFVFYLIICSKDLREWFKKDWLVRVLLVYVVLVILSGIWGYKRGNVNKSALLDGYLIDLRFLAFFGVTAVVTYYNQSIKKYWRYILVIPSLVVIAFGIVQLFLPYNFLSHFGYGPKTIPAYETVNHEIQYQRIQSTLRGANPLGAYLVLIIPAILLSFRRKVWLRVVILAAALVALLFSYSRSAWVGLVITLVALVYLVWVKPEWRKKYLISCIVLAFIAVIGVVSLRYNTAAENIFFHTNKTTTSRISSNSQRTSALKSGLKSLIHKPLGSGTGSSGAASEHNNHPARIPEDYFIQIGQETGWLGIALFVAINIMVGIRLWRVRSDTLAILLLVSLIGISLVNLVSLAWADDTLSLIWWGLAGVMLTPDIIKKAKPKSDHGKTFKKTIGQTKKQSA